LRFILAAALIAIDACLLLACEYIDDAVSALGMLAQQIEQWVLFPD
jgi:hypothetical protein